MNKGTVKCIIQDLTWKASSLSTKALQLSTM